MKKSLCLLAVCVLLIALFPLSASADLLPPPEVSPAPAPTQSCSPLLPILLIAAAVLIVAFVLWRVLRKKT